MRSSEMAEFYKFFYNESNRLENEFIIKWNNIYSQRKLDTLDLLDLIELSVQLDYLNYIEQRIQKILKLLQDIY